MANLKDLVVNGPSRFLGPIYGKISSADTADNCPKYFALSGGTVTGNSYFSAVTIGLPKGESHSNIINWSSASGFTTDYSCTATNFNGHIYNCSYTFVGDDVRVQSRLIAKSGFVQTLTCGNLNTDYIYCTGSTYVNDLSATGSVQAASGSFTNVYGHLYGTADSATNCPNHLALVGNTRATRISGSVYVDGHSWYLKSVGYGSESSIGFNVGGLQVLTNDSSIPLSISKDSHDATIFNNAGGGTGTLMTAWAIKQYVESKMATSITITI